MEHFQITAAQQVKPRWALAERDIDICDIWQEIRDPENEHGEYVTAYLSYDSWGEELHVDGVCVEHERGVVYYDRDQTISILGEDAIWRIEQHEMEAA